MEPAFLRDLAQKNLSDTLATALEHTPERQALIIFDEASGLSKLLAGAYRKVLPGAHAMDFDRAPPDAILEAIHSISPGGLVVLVQSTSFRLNQFRIRIELFNRKLKVIEHPHLTRIRPEEYATYIDSLAYDPSYYRTVGPWLGNRIARASQIKIITEAAELIYDSPFEIPRLNIGHYAKMKNIGGQFPIGEIFSEPREVRNTNGTVKLFAFGDSDFSVNVPERPFTGVVEQGILVDSPDAPRAFHAVLDDIRAKEQVVWLRELGFGLNRAFSRERRVTDIGAFERMCGIHLSLGAKHLQYKKPGFPKKQGFHVDVFVDTPRVEIDGTRVFEKDRYLVTPL